jgi:hypothetical protein
VIAVGLLTYFWIVDFPENAHKSFHFLTAEEQELAVTRIKDDRGDVKAEDFSFVKCLVHFLDPKLYGFCALLFCLNLVSTSMSPRLDVDYNHSSGHFSNDNNC